MLQGGRSGTVPYLVDENGRKTCDKAEKEQLMRRIWSKTFKVSDEENQHFDTRHEENINRYNEENRHRMISYLYADLNRLNENDYLTKPITIQDIKAIK